MYLCILTEFELFSEIKFASLSSALRWFVNSNLREDEGGECSLLGVEVLELDE